MRSEEEIISAAQNASGVIQILEEMEKAGLDKESTKMFLAAMSAEAEVESLDPEFFRGMERALLWVLGHGFHSADAEIEDLTAEG